MTEIRLAPAELMQGALVGVMRQAQNLRDGRRPRQGADSTADWQYHVEGALGELAIAKVLGVYSHAAHAFGARDVAGFEVRTTTRLDGRLLVYPDAPTDAVYLLLVGANGSYRLAGWALAAAVRLAEFYGTLRADRPQPLYRVPQTALAPVPMLDGRVDLPTLEARIDAARKLAELADANVDFLRAEIDLLRAEVARLRTQVDRLGNALVFQREQNERLRAVVDVARECVGLTREGEIVFEPSCDYAKPLADALDALDGERTPR